MTEKNQDLKKTIPFYPDHVRTEIRVTWIVVGIVMLIGLIGVLSPVGVGDPADPMVTPAHVKPEWYFLALYQLLKYIPKTLGVMLPIAGVLIVFIWPFLDRKDDSPRQTRIRLIVSAVLVVMLIAGTLWGEWS